MNRVEQDNTIELAHLKALCKSGSYGQSINDGRKLR